MDGIPNCLFAHDLSFPALVGAEVAVGLIWVGEASF
jgi:hypothetical protein